MHIAINNCYFSFEIRDRRLKTESGNNNNTIQFSLVISLFSHSHDKKATTKPIVLWATWPCHANRTRPDYKLCSIQSDCRTKNRAGELSHRMWCGLQAGQLGSNKTWSWSAKEIICVLLVARARIAALWTCTQYSCRSSGDKSTLSLCKYRFCKWNDLHDPC